MTRKNLINLVIIHYRYPKTTYISNLGNAQCTFISIY